jgi:hypothetical protein
MQQGDQRVISSEDWPELSTHKIRLPLEDTADEFGIRIPHNNDEGEPYREASIYFLLQSRGMQLAADTLGRNDGKDRRNLFNLPTPRNLATWNTNSQARRQVLSWSTIYKPQNPQQHQNKPDR